MGCSSCSNNSSGVPNGCKSNGSCGTGGCDKMSVFDWLENMQVPSGEKQFNIVEIRFKNDRKEYFRNSSELSLYISDIVAVEAASGFDIGVVSLKGELVRLQLSKKKITEVRSLPDILRKATEEDIAKWHKAREEEKRIMPIARTFAIQEKLKMKISDIEFQGDMSKATFYYTAEQRVDFRELIKRFSSEFKVRIEMKQIGMRQEAGKLGGIGSCGRELCCSTWLTDFRSVNTSAARYQQLSLNPQKLAGQCGKLKCCLNYELDAYMELMKTFPKTNIQLQLESGKARHQKTNVFKKMMWYSVETKDRNNDFIGLSVDRVKEVIEMNKAGKKPISLKEFVDFEPELEEEKYGSVDAQDSLTRFDNNFKNLEIKRGRTIIIEIIIGIRIENQTQMPIINLRNRVVFLMVSIIFLGFYSCKKETIFYQEYREMEQEEWRAKDKQSFEFEIKDTSSIYDLYLNLRNTKDYPYSNLYVFWKLESPEGKVKTDTSEFIIAKPNGQWLGKTISGTVIDNSILFLRKKLPSKGVYTITFTQGMRDEPLYGIKDIGFKLKKNNE